LSRSSFHEGLTACLAILFYQNVPRQIEISRLNLRHSTKTLHLEHGYPTGNVYYGADGHILNYLCIVIITRQFRHSATPLTVIVQRADRQSTRNGSCGSWALAGRPFLRQFTERTCTGTHTACTEPWYTHLMYRPHGTHTTCYTPHVQTPRYTPHVQTPWYTHPVYRLHCT